MLRSSVVLRALAPRSALAVTVGARPLACRRLSSSGPTHQTLVPAEEMPLVLRRRVAAIESLHARFEEMEEEHHAQLRELEAAFNERTSKLHERRDAIVQGEDEPTDEEVQASAYFAEFEEALQDGSLPAPPEEGKAVTGVPAFWPTALRQSEMLDEFGFGEKDWTVLNYLISAKAEPWEAEQEGVPEGWDLSLSDQGFALHFTFAPNPYLETLELSLYCNGDAEVLEATTPVWVDDATDPTVHLTTKKMKKKGGGPAKTRVVPKPVESFFRIFAVAEPSADREEDLREGALIPLADLQGEIVVRLKEEIIPRAGIHYFGALHGYDMGDDDDIFDGGDLDDDDWEPAPKGSMRR